MDKKDLTRHDKWLCMMPRRLKLLRELLRDDGVIFMSIFVSIDDNEAHRLRTWRCSMSIRAPHQPLRHPMPDQPHPNQRQPH
jgi:hypothetical protein